MPGYCFFIYDILFQMMYVKRFMRYLLTETGRDTRPGLTWGARERTFGPGTKIRQASANIDGAGPVGEHRSLSLVKYEGAALDR